MKGKWEGVSSNGKYSIWINHRISFRSLSGLQVYSTIQSIYPNKIYYFVLIFGLWDSDGQIVSFDDI